MSRVIKFRAFDPKNGMFEPYSVRNGKAFVIKSCRKDSPEVRVDGINFYCNWDIDVATDFAVMQFTGLTDVNGVEIYEGDICIWYINDLERLGEVYYHDQSFEMRSPSMGYIGWDANRGEIEVIGNIYQNLELLK